MRQLGASSAILDHKANAALLFMCEISVWRTKNGQLQEKKKCILLRCSTITDLLQGT